MLKQFLFGGPGGASRLADVGLLILRASIGLMLAFGHGMGKLSPAAREQMTGFLQSKGIPAPGAAAFAAMFAEFFGGLLLALGLLTRPAAFLIAFTMLVAVTTAHLHDPLFMHPGPGGAKEPALLYMLPALLFLFTGSGRYGMDALARRRSGVELAGIGGSGN
jgi:putative oxidoreductase